MMLRRFFLAASLATSVGLCAQNQSTTQGQPGVTQPSSPSVVVVPASPSVYVVGGGTYGTGIYLTNPGTLPVQNTGISLAGRAGISLETPLQTGTVSFLPSGIPGTPVYGATAVSGAASESGVGEAVAAPSGRLINDMGPSYYESGSAAAGPPAPSLGEIAAQYKTQHPRSVRTFTNADAQRLAGTVIIPGAAVVPASPQTEPQQEPAQNPPPKE